MCHRIGVCLKGKICAAAQATDAEPQIPDGVYNLDLLLKIYDNILLTDSLLKIIVIILRNWYSFNGK